jgi:hypothetical protein
VLTFAHAQQRDRRWCLVDLVGKRSRVRIAPIPTWVNVAIDAWTSAARGTFKRSMTCEGDTI